MKMLDTNKQSTYFIIHEAKHPHFGNSVISQEKPLFGSITQISTNWIWQDRHNFKLHSFLFKTVGILSHKPYQVSSYNN